MQELWDPDHLYDPRKLPESKALEVPPVPGVLPYSGARNPFTRSNSAHRICTTIATPATEMKPTIYVFESAAEWAVGLEVMLDPDVYALDVQLPPFKCRTVSGSKEVFWDHFLDLRVTFKDGFRRAIYVKNGTGLKSRRVQKEIAAIEAALPAELADDMIVVNADDYTRPRRDNLFRFWLARQKVDAAADAHLFEKARTSSYWLLNELIAQCDMPPNRMFQAAKRLVSLRLLGADWNSIFNENSRVWTV